MIKKTLTAFVVLLVLVSISCQERYPDLEDGLYAEIETTKGTMVAKLFYDKVPVTVANFVALAEGNHPMVEEQYKNKPFYDSLTFHRVMDNFMIQGGDPLGNGTGTPGYKFVADFSPDLRHDKPGILSMANAGGINTNGSQFFITERPYPRGDIYDQSGKLKPCDQPGVSCHSVFGELVIGLDVQDSISNVKVAGRNKPVEDVVIEKVNIIRKGKDAKFFDAPKVFEEEMPKVEEKFMAIRAEAKEQAEQMAMKAKEEWLKKNEALDGRRIDSPTGMAMIFTYESNGVKPEPTQSVNIDCAGYFEDGTLFWTTWKEIAEKNGKYDERQDKAGYYAPFAMPYNETASLVAGFREAMLNMKIGDKARVFIPYYLGYGDAGRPPVIPGGTNLVFDIELVSIKN
ncbi:peptidylprolyl isomerase [Winogradskyella alexanderae]|uniref:peptidylprolyl isomerase n=1 Tax=Winogradskyella alexanderae TaxID=2877123 RepID=A0ABS7XSW2_9FLAO|nr:peptidylprolyl isomerase [Winogradskyella alexanderae]MCA0132126.1 peptidylprolyl isomerase [Winogradskyella alexanderae]